MTAISRWSRAGAAICAVSLGAACASTPPFSADAAPELILVGGKLRGPGAGASHSALAIDQGRIVAVGSDNDVLARKGPGTQLVSLDGAEVLPGLVDAHLHLFGVGASLRQLDLRGTRSVDEVIDRVRERAAELGPSDWVLGRGWDQNDWPDARFPELAELDRLDAAVGGRPALVRRVDGHAAWASRAALARAGIGPETADPEGGRILRSEDGQPTGVLVDRAMDLVREKIGEPSDAELERRALAAQDALLSTGLTGVHDAGMGVRELEVLEGLMAAGKFRLRVYVMIYGEDPRLNERLSRGPQQGLYGGRLSVRAVKLLSDGALGSRGAALKAPYSDEPEHQGLMQLSPEVLSAKVDEVTGAGFQIAVHAIGDRAIASTLNAIEAAGRPELRPRIEHLQVFDPADLPRLKPAGVVASMQPTHCTSDMPWAEARIGQARLAGAYAWRRVRSADIPLAFGSDAPVERWDPRLGLRAATTRQDGDGQPEGGWLPDQRLSEDEAIHAFTAGAAYAAFQEKELGRLAEGFRADLSIFAAGDGPLHERALRMTVVDGDVVYEAAD